MAELRPDSGSFRDRGGRILHADERVFRTVMPAAAEDFEFVRSTGLIDTFIADGKLIGETRMDERVARDIDADAACVLEHPKLEFLSWPYEWPFSALKKAALFHLDLHLAALERGVTLSDATAYNVQFEGTRPVFIDHLSFRPYVDGEFWAAHRQFCEQFLNPLVLQSAVGIPFNSWYRGSLEGIPSADLNAVLPLGRKFSWNVLTHISMQARLQSASTEEDARRRLDEKKLPLVGFREILAGLRRWIQKLEPAAGRSTVWQNYPSQHSYATGEESHKRAFIAEFATIESPRLLIDLGCNTGDYSKVALEAGAGRVIGFDFDEKAADAAFRRAERDGLRFLALVMDAANPSPSMGWRQSERAGLRERAVADATLALALIHHLVIGRNLPLEQVLDWILDMAPTGVIEFVPKRDPMVQRLLRLKPDIFDDYSAAHFEWLLTRRAAIVSRQEISAHGRTLYWFRRND